jgi:hypothetical protein
LENRYGFNIVGDFDTQDLIELKQKIEANFTLEQMKANESKYIIFLNHNDFMKIEGVTGRSSKEEVS